MIMYVYSINASSQVLLLSTAVQTHSTV